MWAGRAITSACLFCLACAAVAGQEASAPATGPASFRVVLQGKQVGTAATSVERVAGGWRLSGSSRLVAPINLTVRRLEVSYDDAWHPLFVRMEMVTPTRTALVQTGFQHGRAYTDIISNGEVTSESAGVAEDTIVLPNQVFSTYEALAARLEVAMPGAAFRRYIMPQGEIAIRVDDVRDDTLPTTRGPLAVKRWGLTFENPVQPYPVEVWTARGRLVQLSFPSQALTVVRTDVRTP